MCCNMQSYYFYKTNLKLRKVKTVKKYSLKINSFVNFTLIDLNKLRYLLVIMQEKN